MLNKRLVFSIGKSSNMNPGSSKFFSPVALGKSLGSALDESSRKRICPLHSFLANLVNSDLSAVTLQNFQALKDCRFFLGMKISPKSKTILLSIE